MPRNEHAQTTPRPLAAVALFIATSIALVVSVTFALSVYYGRFEDPASNSSVVLHPWISDTIELDPENGLANIVLGPCAAAFVVVVYLWQVRCEEAARRSDESLHTALYFSRTITGVSFLMCLLTHGTLGFKLNTLSDPSGKLHRGFAIALAVAYSFVMCAVTYVEWKTSLSSFPLSATRAVLCLLNGICLITAAVIYGVAECPMSHITRIASSTDDICIQQAVQTSCYMEVLDASSACAVPPWLELFSVVSLILFLASMSSSMWTARVSISVVDSRFRTLSAEERAQLSAFDDHKHGFGGVSRASAQGRHPTWSKRDAEQACHEAGAEQHSKAATEEHNHGQHAFRGEHGSAPSSARHAINSSGEGAHKAGAREEAEVVGVDLFKQLFERTAAMKRRQLLSDSAAKTLEGILLCFEADLEEAEGQPDPAVLAERLQKLLVSGAAELKGSRRMLKDLITRRKRERGGDSRQHGSWRQRGGGAGGGGGGRDGENGGEAAARRMRGRNEWHEMQLPGLQDLSEFDPVTPAVTAEQRRRLSAAKHAIKHRSTWMGQPRTPEQAWEAHLQALQHAGPPTDNPATDTSLPGPLESQSIGPAPKPMLAAKLARNLPSEGGGGGGGGGRNDDSLDDVHI